MAEGRLSVWPWGLAAIALFALDRGVKIFMSDSLVYGEPLPVLPGFFNLTLLHNPGAAFSFLASGDGWQRWLFVAIAVGVSGWILWSLSRMPAGSRWSPTAFTLILGGAVGNGWDRIAYGYVVDFIQVCHAGACFPAFNLADSAITAGAAMVLVDMLRELRR